ncbi:hypothetical protein EVAR_52487_1 [Eumeta japonica]|uniref:Uncharacterized protein n=1 Tax=Eumeta variegata TaxID=151549 RepID=A0A4C1ZGP4_EUMVA|nr:hypothetical protein EVAR_52487_1 [Eumeta japonica]
MYLTADKANKETDEFRLELIFFKDDKITMLMARPGADSAQKDDVSWWMRYSARGLGTVGGFLKNSLVRSPAVRFGADTKGRFRRELLGPCPSWARGSRDDMAAMAAGGSTPPGAPTQDHNVTLMEDPDVWRPN